MFRSFFGRIENSNFFFEIYWPLVCEEFDSTLTHIAHIFPHLHACEGVQMCEIVTDFAHSHCSTLILARDRTYISAPARHVRAWKCARTLTVWIPCWNAISVPSSKLKVESSGLLYMKHRYCNGHKSQSNKSSQLSDRKTQKLWFLTILKYSQCLRNPKK